MADLSKLSTKEVAIRAGLIKPEMPTEKEMLFPRATAAPTAGRKITGGLLDIITGGQRSLAALPAALRAAETEKVEYDPAQYIPGIPPKSSKITYEPLSTEEREKQKIKAGRIMAGKEKGGTLQQILTDPALIPATIATIGTGGAGLIPTLAGTGTSIAAHQAEAYAEKGQLAPKEAAIEGGLSALLMGMGGLAGPLKRSGISGLQRIVKPTLRMSKTFKPEKIFEKKLGGTLSGMLKKTEQKWKVTSKKFGKVLKEHEDKEINLQTALGKTRIKFEEMMKTKRFGPDEKKAIQEEYTKWVNHILEDTKTGIVNIRTAQNLKQSVGRVGDWEPSLTQSQIKAKAQFIDDFYDSIDQEINKIAPELKPMNKELSELRPIKQALIEGAFRIGKHNLISLSDLLTFVPGATSGAPQMGKMGAALGIGSRITKSPYITSKLYGAGQALEPTRGAIPKQAALRFIQTKTGRTE